MMDHSLIIMACILIEFSTVETDSTYYTQNSIPVTEEVKGNLATKYWITTHIIIALLISS